MDPGRAPSMTGSNWRRVLKQNKAQSDTRMPLARFMCTKSSTALLLHQPLVHKSDLECDMTKHKDLNPTSRGFRYPYLKNCVLGHPERCLVSLLALLPGILKSEQIGSHSPTHLPLPLTPYSLRIYLDARKVNSRSLVDSNAVAHNAQAAVGHGTAARHHLRDKFPKREAGGG